MSPSQSEFQLIRERVGAVITLDNCTSTEKRASIEVELWERDGLEALDQARVEATVPSAEMGYRVRVEDLDPRQIGEHYLVARLEGDETRSGLFGVW